MVQVGALRLPLLHMHCAHVHDAQDHVLIADSLDELGHMLLCHVLAESRHGARDIATCMDAADV